MKSLDTNILARLILADDPAQAIIAVRLLAEPVWVTTTVWLELGWLLGKKLALDREMVCEALGTLLAIETVHSDNRDGLLWAIERYRAGADWADVVHLVMSRGVGSAFATFDRRIARFAGEGSPLPIETLS
uniref:type II toxin-antitoxin system VapC family toxin n=1 Tax=uncultured Sphingomonas sp. TaxID=158754 RepID=UPI0035CB5E44